MSPGFPAASLCVAGDLPMSSETRQVILEQCSIFRFEWGGGGVIAEIPSAVYRSAAPLPPSHHPPPSPPTWAAVPHERVQAPVFYSPVWSTVQRF